MHASKRSYFLGVVCRERANRPSVTSKLDLPLLPITLHLALVAVGVSLCTLRITMLSIDSIRFDSTRNPTPHAFTRAHLYPTIVTSFRLSTRKDPSRLSSSVSVPRCDSFVISRIHPPSRRRHRHVMTFSWDTRDSSVRILP
jgi:hypothetical protein